MSSFTDYQVAQFFASLPGTPYLAMHYANPALGGLGAAEFSGGSYTRHALPLSAVNSRAVYNTTPVLFTGLSASTLAFLGIWDASSGGNLRAYIAVLPTVAISSGGQFPVGVGDIALTF